MKPNHNKAPSKFSSEEFSGFFMCALDLALEHNNVKTSRMNYIIYGFI